MSSVSKLTNENDFSLVGHQGAEQHPFQSGHRALAHAPYLHRALVTFSLEMDTVFISIQNRFVSLRQILLLLRYILCCICTQILYGVNICKYSTDTLTGSSPAVLLCRITSLLKICKTQCFCHSTCEIFNFCCSTFSDPQVLV